MAGHIGIVGCSAEGASLCYRTICAEGAARLGGHSHPEVTLHTPSLQDYVDCLEAADVAGIAELMLGSAEILARAGADFLICPDNTIHQALPQVVRRSPLPWLSIVDVVADEAARLGLHRLGILGTRWLMESDLYPTALSGSGVEALVPDEGDRAEIGRIIMDELVPGRVLAASTNRLIKSAHGLRDRGCDGVVLGCTELPLVLDDSNLGMPALDSTRLLARAALDHAVSV
ncbi:MAG: amino acid racemase [Pseudomonadota bacterium]